MRYFGREKMNIREIFLSIFFRGFICLILILITDITFAQSIEVLKQKEIQRPQTLREKRGQALNVEFISAILLFKIQYSYDSSL